MFSGQGSQYFHMGRALFEGNHTFRSWMLQLDAGVRRISGTSVVDQLYSDANRKSDVFDRTLLTHPAIFMVEYSLAQCLMHEGVQPDMVLGASLGTFAAAAVAGSVDVDDALSVVVRQAMAFEESCEPGGMIAVLADPALFGESFLRDRSELAGVNFSTHFIVSARRTDLDGIEADLRGRDVSFQRLPVSFAFHSRWIESAKEAFASTVRSVPYRQGRIPLICCERTDVWSDLSEEYFWDVVRHPIRFRETVARLETHGAHRYIDVGPAGTLATFLKYGLPATSKSTVHSILTPFGVDQKNLAALLASASKSASTPVLASMTN